VTQGLRRCLAVAGLALGLQVQASDCPPAPPAPSADEIARAAAQPRDRGFLWRIDKGGRSSWLYGTIHLGRLEWTFPGPKVREALQASDVAAFELDFTDPALMQRLQGAIAAAAREAPTLPDDLAARLRERLQAACAPPELQQALPPEMLGVTLMLMSARRDGLEVGHAIDPALAQLARQEGKPVLSLETPEQQIKLLRSETPAELRESLDKILRDLEQDRARPLLLRVAEVWEQGRAGELARYRNWCDCARTPRERRALKALLDERNGPMAARIDALHAGGQTVFAAVGSLHLVGPSALPSLLAARGYRVTRIGLQR
jgi:uncharacterized protein YbaP (TraB family)